MVISEASCGQLPIAAGRDRHAGETGRPGRPGPRGRARARARAYRSRGRPVAWQRHKHNRTRRDVARTARMPPLPRGFCSWCAAGWPTSSSPLTSPLTPRAVVRLLCRRRRFPRSDRLAVVAGPAAHARPRENGFAPPPPHRPSTPRETNVRR